MLIFNELSPSSHLVPMDILAACLDIARRPYASPFSSCLPRVTISFVISLYKEGSKIEANNYRGISKLSAIPQLFENIITLHLQHLSRSVKSQCQHDFMKRRSTTYNLLEITSFVIRGLQKYFRAHSIYTDLGKAFY